MESLPYINFLNPENAATFWQFVRAILYIAMPFLLIYLATRFGGELISVIRNAFSSRGENGRNDERDYDIKIKDSKGGF